MTSTVMPIARGTATNGLRDLVDPDRARQRRRFGRDADPVARLLDAESDVDRRHLGRDASSCSSLPSRATTSSSGRPPLVRTVSANDRKLPTSSPSTDRIRSPRARPARAAGESGSTVETSTLAGTTPSADEAAERRDLERERARPGRGPAIDLRPRTRRAGRRVGVARPDQSSTGWPSSETITSPERSPARCAGPDASGTPIIAVRRRWPSPTQPRVAHLAELVERRARGDREARLARLAAALVAQRRASRPGGCARGPRNRPTTRSGVASTASSRSPGASPARSAGEPASTTPITGAGRGMPIERA